MSPHTYFETLNEQYMYEKLIKYKYHGMTFYKDEDDDSNNVYSDDECIDFSASYFNAPIWPDEHHEDDDFTQTTFNYHMENNSIQ
jgi:hypothetical protein